MATSTWAVHMNKQGRPMDVQVQAANQAEARRFAEHQYPGYKAGSSKRV